MYSKLVSKNDLCFNRASWKVIVMPSPDALSEGRRDPPLHRELRWEIRGARHCTSAESRTAAICCTRVRQPPQELTEFSRSVSETGAGGRRAYFFFAEAAGGLAAAPPPPRAAAAPASPPGSAESSHGPAAVPACQCCWSHGGA